MKRKIIVLSLVIVSIFTTSAQEYRKSVQLYDKMTETEQRYMKFLYDYMPLSDLADYTQDYFLYQVRTTIEAKNYFRWGKTIPDEVFMHFVLPVRVNNENLDTARQVFFSMLKERIKDMTMYDAIKEVNHFAHEHVNYKGSDGRTSSPLATLNTSWGRCGEESTFVVSALRAVSIPARQCYTPRWAHTDDNHAWVEAWADGKWYYFGACEPNAELNSGWFDSPVKRAMMVHTTVLGKYEGSEQKNYETPLYSRINLLANYTTTKTLKIHVTNAEGKPIKDADVDFGLYNYAEYYPISRSKTDANGDAVLITGLGDLMISVTDGTLFNTHIAKAEDTLCNINLTSADLKPFMRELILTPPVEKIVKAASDEAVEENNRRLAYEDSLREAYIHTFPQYKRKDNQIYNDTSTYADSITIYYNNVIDKSWGNYKEIEKFFNYTDSNPFCVTTGKEITDTAKAIFENIYEKDLRDITYDVLKDHYDAFMNGEKQSKKYNKETIDKYIINPRIQLEKITPWRSFLQKEFSGQEKAFRKNPQEIVKWIAANIKLNTKENYYGQVISPEGVMKVKEADEVSRQVLFVAICRSLGIAARYEWATGRSQYLIPKGDWLYAIFGDEKAKVVESKTNVIVTSSNANDTKPEYFYHFALSKLTDGRFKTLDYEYDMPFSQFPDTLLLSNDYYRLLTARRADDGSVFVREEYFNLTGKDTTLCITLPKVNTEPKVLSHTDLERQSVTIKGQSQTLKSLCGEKGLLFMFVNPANEPTRHLIADFATLKSEFESEKVGIVAAICGDNSAKHIAESMVTNFPNQTLFEEENALTMLKSVTAAISYDFGNNYPLLVFVNQNGDVVFISEGYRIAAPDSILKIIRTIK